ncbi:MAG TPA: thioredoxin-disulfide reductase [Kosmotogaceae bacterium]|nr:MAG: Thioredoxin reductase [Thermotogales bacterium 46_20]HAA85023.1 thioredoxin-disulfide reductase [Kosmotogaceae bacterium]
MSGFEVGGLGFAKEVEDQYDVIIIGGGPGGITASIYAVQGGLSPLIVERAIEGGQMNNTETIENWTGFKSISGVELSERMAEHARHFGVDLLSSEVTGISQNGDKKIVILETGKQIEARVLIIATGANPRKLHVPGEKEFSGKGVSYCATCDGHFFSGKHVAVIGGGNSSMTGTLYLSKIAERITVIQDLPKLTADKMLQDRVKALSKVEFLLGRRVKEIHGDDKVRSVLIEGSEGKKEELETDGVFVFVGTEPNSEFLSGVVERDEYGYIKVNEKKETSVPGVYAIGDVIQKEVRQIATAAGDAAIAIHHAILDDFN